MDPELVQIFGTRFPLYELEDLELLTDLLEISGNPLGVVFAVASHLEHVPDGDRAFRPLLRQRLGRSLRELGWPPVKTSLPRSH